MVQLFVEQELSLADRAVDELVVGFLTKLGNSLFFGGAAHLICAYSEIQIIGLGILRWVLSEVVASYSAKVYVKLVKLVS